MKRMTVYLRLVMLFGFLATGLLSSGQSPSTVTRANIVIDGIVTEIGKASFSAVPQVPNLVVMKITRVLKDPPAISLSVGDQITAVLKDTSTVKVGTELRVQGRLWIVGEGLAVQALSEATAPPNGDIETFAAADSQAHDNNISSRAAAADLIIVGRIKDIQKPLVAANTQGPISEHDPQWRDAVIEVQTWIKGSAESSSIVVRFPASRDVAFRDYPKFQVGQESTLFLKTAQNATHILAATPVPNKINNRPAFLAITKTDVAPAWEAAHIKALVNKLKATTPSK
jgi:hypothetical protein